MAYRRRPAERRRSVSPTWRWQDSNGLMTIKEISRGCDLTVSPAGVARLQAAAILCLTLIRILVQIAYFGRFTPGFMVLVTIEEVAEMASIGLFLCAVIDYAASAVGTVLIRIPAMSRNRS